MQSTSEAMSTDKAASAPWLQAPGTSVISVEHPCIVQNIDKAIQMLGGPEEIVQSLSSDTDKPLGLKFKPDDPASRTIISYNNKTDNLLLELTVPKRTGRKRKRGSSDPFVEDASSTTPRKSAASLLRALKDNPEKYKVGVVGSIQSTHVWRTMPDFVYSAKGSTVLNEIKTKILPQQYPLLQRWSFPQTYGLANTETFPPPVLSTQSLPFNYTYRQNPAVKMVADPVTGKRVLRNTTQPLKLFTYQCLYDEVWPDKPHPKCIPLSQQPQILQRVCKTLKDLFETRPIWTRRALVNQLPDDVPLTVVRQGVAYVSFAIRSGPWRDTLCKFGVDPRKDPSCRKYQSVLIQLLSRSKDKADLREDYVRTWMRSADKESHIFTGKSNVPPDGKSWQLCDLHEPYLKALAETPDVYIRHECETRYFGWYANGTMAKIRVTIKALIDALLTGEALNEAGLQKFLTLPDDWQLSEPEPAGIYLPKDAGKQELEWASTYRSLCRTLGGTVPTSGGSGQGRLSKPKPSTRSSFLDDGEDAIPEELDNGGYDEADDDGDNDNIDLDDQATEIGEASAGTSVVPDLSMSAQGQDEIK